jgi:hypothetical protein
MRDKRTLRNKTRGGLFSAPLNQSERNTKRRGKPSGKITNGHSLSNNSSITSRIDPVCLLARGFLRHQAISRRVTVILLIP